MTARATGRALERLVDGSRVEAAMWRRHMDAPSPASRTALFSHYRPFSLRVARDEWRRSGGHGCEREDFEQLATEGLLQAIDRFDALCQARFESYARLRIRGCILNGLAKASEASAQFSHRKRQERDRLRSLREATETAAPALDQLADLAVMVALGVLLQGHAGEATHDTACDAPTAFETLAWNQLCDEIDRRVAQLPEKEALVIEQHYRHDLQFQQIAALLGVSKGRVSQLHASAIGRLRRYLPSQR